MFLISILILAIIFVIDWFAAKQFHEIAKMKGHSESKYLWWCFWLGMIGWLMVVALPDRRDTPSNMAVSSDELPDL